MKHKDTSDGVLVRAKIGQHMGAIFSHFQLVPSAQRASELIYYARLGWDAKHNPVQPSPGHSLGSSLPAPEPAVKAAREPPAPPADKMKSYIESLGNIEDSLMPPSA